MNNATELQHNLAQFTGTEQWHFNPMYRWMNYTDGVQYFAQTAGGGAYWFLDIIGTELRKYTPIEPFIQVKLIVKGDRTAVIEADDGNDCPPFYTRELEFTDCPEGTWRFYLIDGVLLLPSEY
jgi:hypothetical protein